MKTYLQFPALALLCLTAITDLAAGQIRAPVLIAPGTPGFVADLTVAGFGQAIAAPGDLNGDGVPDLVVGSASRVGETGALWFLFLNPDGSVSYWERFSIDEDGFGGNVVSLGDLDLDGNIDLAASTRGINWVLYLDSDGNVDRQVSFDGSLGPGLASLGDVNGDSVPDLAYGGNGSPDGGALLIAYLNRGDLDNVQTSGAIWGLGREGVPHNGFGAVTDTGDLLGASIASVGDLDGDGVPDLVAAAPGDDDITQQGGALYVMFLAHQQTPASDVVDRWRKISTIEAGVPDDGIDNHLLGWSLQGLGDLNKDGMPEVAAMSMHDGSEFRNRGAVRILSLGPDGSVNNVVTISGTDGNFTGALSDEDLFGSAVAPIGDLNGDGVIELAIGAPGSDIAGIDRGAVWIYDLNNSPPVVSDVVIDPLPAEIGRDVTATAQLTSLSGGSEASLLFRRGGDDGFFASDMVETQPGLFSFAIPGFAVSETGIEVTIEARNPATGSSIDFPEFGVMNIPVRAAGGLSFSVPGEGSYRLISAPLILDDPLVESVLSDDLGDYISSEWRLFILGGSGRVREFGPGDVIEPGAAMWLTVREANPVLNTGPGTSVATDRSFEILLRRGWNLIGNPFAFEIPLANVTTGTSTPVELWAYNGSWEQETEHLVPFSGYAVFADGVETLSVDPNLTPLDGSASEHQASHTKTELDLERRSQLEALFSQISDPGDPRNSSSISLHQNYPNPFRNTTHITFYTPASEKLSLTVYDVLGRTTATLFDEEIRAGRHEITWDGRTDLEKVAAAGVYFVKLESGSQIWVRKVSFAP